MAATVLREASAPARGGERRLATIMLRGGPLIVLPLSCGLLAAGAAGRTAGTYLPGERGVWPTAFQSPLAGVGPVLSPALFLALTLALVLCYLLLLRSAPRLPLAAVLAALACSYALLAAGPPLLSRDIFGYLGYARMVVDHGLNPYAQLPAAMGHDPVLPLMGWPRQHTPYGPLFTALTLPIALLRPPAAFWMLKGLFAAAALAAVALIAAAAARRGRNPSFAAVAFGANPAFVELTVGGSHNDTVLLALVGLALLLFASPASLKQGLSAAVGAVAMKLSAAPLPVLLLLSPAPTGSRLSPRQRRGLIIYTLILAAGATAAGLAAFGTGSFGLLAALGAEQRIVSPHSLPSEAAIALGLGGPPLWLKAAFLAGFAALAATLAWRTWRGYDWLTACGFVTCGLLLATAWFVPWYASWPLPFAALSPNRRLRALALALSFYALTFHLPYISPLLGKPLHPARP